MKQTLANQVYEIIKGEIIHGVLEPGKTFPLADFIKRYQFGITPTREAMTLLEQEGYVKIDAHYGYVIKPITLEDVKNVFELRAVLETSAARLAAQRATESQIQEIMDAVYRQPSADLVPDPLPSFMIRNHAFHVTIAKASGNYRLATALAQILEEQMRVLLVYFKIEAREGKLDFDHLAIAEAIKSRDADLAEKLIYEDVTYSLANVTAKMEQNQKN